MLTRWSQRVIKPFFSRFFSSDPSLEQLEAFMSVGESASPFVCDILSDELVSIRSVDGIGIGSHVCFGSGVNGVVLQFDSAKATVALQGKGSVSRDSIVSVQDTKSFFKIKALKINSDPSECTSKLKTHVPVVDMLLGPRLLAGQTIGIYSSWFFHPGSGSLRFPSSPEVPKTSFQLYQELFEVANKAIAQTAFGDVHLVADFRNFEVACSSLEFQAGHALPVSPQSLVASVLQLSHRTRKTALSVTAIFNSKSDFKGESAQNVDIPIELAGDDNETVSNLESLLVQRACFASSKQPSSSSLSREEDLIRHLVEGFREKSEINYKKKAGVFVDFWEAEQIDSFDTLLRLLSPVSKLYATCSERDRNILMKALTLLHFNKSSERNSSAVSRFPQELLNTLSKLGDPETIDIDSSTIMQHRFEWELTNEVVA